MRSHFFISSIAILAAQAISLSNSSANGSGTQRITFRSKIQSETSLRYVANSGICETTPGVNQFSGYIEVGKNMSMWFWFFESRSSPEDAPFTLWLNGGPGCSSMYGLFVEHGPCLVNSDGKTTYLNPYSWNNISNMLYLDQPIGSGFSYGPEIVNTTEDAAPFVWKAFQILFESQVFSKYASREFIFATESYGGHFAPSFVTYFHEQNTLIARGEIEGECIIVSAVMINNGWIDPLVQWQTFYDFAKNAPGYGQLQPDGILKNISNALHSPNGCIELQKKCDAAGNSPESVKICFDAYDYCYVNVLLASIGELDPYDLRQDSSMPFPLEYYVDYLAIPEVLNKIGAETDYIGCNFPVFFQVLATGDFARSWLPQLSELTNTGLNMLVWAGDTDILCNWLGNYAAVLAMDWYGNETLHNTPFKNITLHGKPIAAVVNVDRFSYATAYDAGHTMPSFQPEASLEIFKQVINKEPLHSV